MIEHALPWTTNLDQLAWSLGEFVLLVVGIVWFVRWVR